MPGKVRSDGFPRPKPDRTEVPGIFCRTVYAMHSILSAMILLQIISVLIVVSALIAALIIGLDLTRRRQPMRIMNPVWILTGCGPEPAAYGLLSFGAPVPQPPTAAPDRGPLLPHPAADDCGRSSERPNRVPGRPPRQPKGNARHTRTTQAERNISAASAKRPPATHRPDNGPKRPCQPYRSSTHAPYRTANKRAIIPSAMPRCRKRSGPRTRVRWRTRPCQAWPA